MAAKKPPSQELIIKPDGSQELIIRAPVPPGSLSDKLRKHKPAKPRKAEADKLEGRRKRGRIARKIVGTLGDALITFGRVRAGLPVPEKKDIKRRVKRNRDLEEVKRLIKGKKKS